MYLTFVVIDLTSSVFLNALSYNEFVPLLEEAIGGEYVDEEDEAKEECFSIMTDLYGGSDCRIDAVPEFVGIEICCISNLPVFATVLIESSFC